MIIEAATIEVVMIGAIGINVKGERSQLIRISMLVYRTQKRYLPRQSRANEFT